MLKRILLLLCMLPGLPAYVHAADELIESRLLTERWTGDYDTLVKNRVIRVLVVHNPMMYFLDKGEQRGITYEAMKLFEEDINKREKTGTMKIHVVLIPVARDQLIPGLIEGRGDIAAANLTITPERQKAVDFSIPAYADASEIVITGPSGAKLEKLEDLSGQEVHVRKSSSYYEHLVALNADFKKRGQEPVKIVEESEYLEDADLLEMVNAGLLPMTVVDSHKAEFWKDIFADIKLHPQIAISTGNQIAWALRKDSPKLKAVVDEFVKKNRKGTLMGNILIKRYLKENKWVRNAMSPKEIEKFNKVVGMFEKYADQYGFDYLMTTALAYQESTLDHSKRSSVGAVGIMQILPSTAADKNVGIPDVKDLEKNIHAGTKYLRFVREQYFNDPAIDPLNQTLLAFASYNAGPARVAGLRRKAKQAGLDPNIWFNNVEVIAAKEIGRETVTYVSNIYKYYITYRLMGEKNAAKQEAIEQR